MVPKRSLSVFAALALALVLAFSAQAAVVGHFTRVEGQVDLLQGGRLPAAAAKVQEAVEPRDVIRTKSKSRAQLLFIDDTVLTLAPESRVAVADYFYDAPQGRRRALLQVFRGLAHTVVKQVLKMQEPSFLMQTQTAIIGVRGTEWYTLLTPNCTYVYNIQGLIELSSSNRLIPGSLLLPARKYSAVCRDRAPGPPQDITPGILAMLQRMMLTGVTTLPVDLTPGRGPSPELPPRLGVPEEMISPYAPTLTPVQPQRTPGKTP